MPKDIRYLSKRRKNQLINRELNNTRISDVLQSVESNITVPNIIEGLVTFIEQVNTYCTNRNILVKDLNELSSELHSDTENDKEYTTDSSDNIPELVDSFDNFSLSKDLQTLIIENNISHNAANKLLQILRKHGHVELPTDVRILFKTPRNASMNIKYLSGGHYVHFGISSGLKRSIKIYYKYIKTNEIKLNINIDELPITKSSGSQFWPIMASIEGINVYTLPIIIGNNNWYISRHA